MEPVFGHEADHPSACRVGGVLDLEVLSPAGRGDEASYLHKGVGERVQAPKFLEFVLADPVPAVALYRAGVPVAAPAPERYALHKLLVAQLRSGRFREKRRKDLDQAGWLLGVLAERRPIELWRAWDTLRRRGRSWRRLADAALREQPNLRAPLVIVEDEFGVAGA